MSKILSLLLASAALTAGLGVPAWSAMHLPQQGEAVTPRASASAVAAAPPRSTEAKRTCVNAGRRAMSVKWARSWRALADQV